MHKISFISLFPEIIETVITSSITGRAQIKGLVKYQFVDLRNFGIGKHKVVDGPPSGGGAGLLLRADTLSQALKSIKTPKSVVILTNPSGKPFNQTEAKKLTKYSELIIISGHYEGVDQRFIDQYVDLEYSIGDYILTNGLLPSLVISDCIVRLIPGVLEKPEATTHESFENNLLEHPQYTKPDQFEGSQVPEILKTGHHANIKDWKEAQSKAKTQLRRPDLLTKSRANSTTQKG